MVTLARRFVVFQAFLLWQGGFLFYAAVVVPVGTDVFGAAAQGAVTQRVTGWLNLAGVAWAAAVFADLLADRPRLRPRLALWAAAVAVLAALWLLHPMLGDLFDADAQSVPDRRAFRRLHIVYLWLSTAHWLLGLALAWLTLAAWTRLPPAGADR